MDDKQHSSHWRFADRALTLDARTNDFLRLLVNLGGYCTVEQARRLALADSTKQTRRRLRELQAEGFLRRVSRYPIVYQVTKSAHRHFDRDSRARRSHLLGTVQARLLAVSFYLAAVRWPAQFVFDHAEKIAALKEAGCPPEALPQRWGKPYLWEDFVIRSEDGKLTVAAVDHTHRSAFSQLRGLLRRFSPAMKRLAGRLSLAVATSSDRRMRIYCRLVRHRDLREHITAKPAMTCYLIRRVPEITMLTWPPGQQEPSNFLDSRELERIARQQPSHFVES